MYDHVTDFKEKLIDILSEIQNMGVIDETGDYTQYTDSIIFYL